MRLLLLLAGSLAALAGCNSGTSGDPPASEQAMIRLAAVPGRPAAGYGTLAVPPGRESLTGVSSPRIGRIEMHETVSHGSMTSMRPLDRVEPAGDGRIVFAPGGRHLMLFDVDPALKPGDRAELAFRFAHGAPVTLSARVIAAGEDDAH